MYKFFRRFIHGFPYNTKRYIRRLQLRIRKNKKESKEKGKLEKKTLKKNAKS